MAADPSVSPADTIRLARELVADERQAANASKARWYLDAVCDIAAALLAVGERDKAEIEALTAAVEGLLDVGMRSRSGDPSLDPEEWYAIRDYAQKVLKDGGGAALRESRERDRRQIAQAEERIERQRLALTEYRLRMRAAVVILTKYHLTDEYLDACAALEKSDAAAVLADEEDAGTELREEDLKVDTYSSGSRSLYTYAAHVRVTHLPTGYVATSDAHASHLAAKAEALTRLREVLARAAGGEGA